MGACTYELRYEKTGLRGFRPGPTQTRLYSHRRWLEALNFGFRKKRDCTIRVAKTKTLISFAVTTKLICVFVFPYAKIRFSHNAANIGTWIYFGVTALFGDPFTPEYNTCTHDLSCCGTLFSSSVRFVVECTGSLATKQLLSMLCIASLPEKQLRL